MTVLTRTPPVDPITAEDIAKRIVYALGNEPPNDEVFVQSRLSRDPEAAASLQALMSDISEQCYCAGWMTDLEYALWDMLHHEGRRYGQGEDDIGNCNVSDVSIAAIRYLAERCDGWWIWHDDTTGAGPNAKEWGPRFVTREAWIIQFGGD